MAEWFVEQGIGEDRAILVANGHIVAARVEWPGALAAGLVTDAKLIARTAGSSRGTLRFANGEEALVDQLPSSASEGATIRVKVLRAAMGEAGRLKRAQARPSDEPARPGPSLLEQVQEGGMAGKLVHRFPVAGWDELVGEAFAGEIAFPGGSLHLSPTPAMTLIDVDGALPAKALALAAVPAIAGALARLDIGGSIGIDFPTLAGRSDRREVDERLNHALLHWPHERTAMNGFGFVQLVAQSQSPSLLQRATFWPEGTAARLLLRRAEAVREPGALLLRAHPRVMAALKPQWLEDLARRTGRQVRRETDPALALEAGIAQFVPS